MNNPPSPAKDHLGREDLPKIPVGEFLVHSFFVALHEESREAIERYHQAADHAEKNLRPETSLH